MAPRKRWPPKKPSLALRVLLLERRVVSVQRNLDGALEQLDEQDQLIAQLETALSGLTLIVETLVRQGKLTGRSKR